MKVIVESCGASAADPFFKAVGGHVIDVLNHRGFGDQMKNMGLVFQCILPKKGQKIEAGTVIIKHSLPNPQRVAESRFIQAIRDAAWTWENCRDVQDFLLKE